VLNYLSCVLPQLRAAVKGSRYWLTRAEDSACWCCPHGMIFAIACAVSLHPAAVTQPAELQTYLLVTSQENPLLLCVLLWATCTMCLILCT
jgi:hypothetical protein